jgi:hypothetical protein
MVERPAASLSRTAWTLVALVAGIVSGSLLHGSTSAWAGRLAAVIGPVGQLWGAALRLMVVPLVITLTLVAVSGTRDDWSIGALGGKTLLLFLVMLVASGLFAMALTPPLVSLYPWTPGRRPPFAPARRFRQLEESGAKPATLASGAGLIPGNIVRRLAERPSSCFHRFLPPPPPRAGEGRPVPIFRALADAAMVLIGWIRPSRCRRAAPPSISPSPAPGGRVLIAFVVLVSES